MAKKPFISVDGITVGEASALVNVILANGDITTNNITVSNSANLGNVGNVIITGGTSGYVLSTNGSGNLSWIAQSTGGGSAISNGTSNVNIPTADGNVTISTAGNANIIVVTGTGANINGYANISGNLTAGNITTGAGTGGNITGANVISANTLTASLSANLGNSVTANYFIGSGANLTSIPAGNISGQVANALVAGTVYTAAQPNITSVGTLTGLTSNGVVNFANTSNTTLGAVGNVHITGGSSGQYLQTDGSGTLSWATVTSGSTSNISNGNSNVNIPSANGNVNISAVGNANIVTVTGTGLVVTGTANVSGNLTAGNITTGAGTGGNITGANVISANTLTATLSADLGNSATANYFIGNLYGTANLATYATTANSVAGANVSGQVGNALVAGTVYTAAQPNITSVGTLSTLNVSGNANVGNIGGGAGVFTANVSANNLTTTNKVTAGNGLLVSSGTVTISNGNLDVTGNLNVTGNVNYSNVTDLVVGDPLIYIGANNTGDSYDLGIVASYNDGTYYHTGLARNHTNDTWTFFDGVVAEPTTVIDWANATYPTVKLGNLTATGSANLTGNITAGNANLGNNVSANFFTGNGVYLTGITTVLNGNSNVSIPSANGNVNISAVGNANVLVVTGTGANIIGSLDVTGNITANNISAGTGSGGSISGGNLISANYLTGTLTTAAQPNITSIGSLTGLIVSNATGVVNFTTTANVTLGAVGNLHISGGSANYILQTDGAGNLSWSAAASGSNISNGNSNVSIASANGNITMSAVGNANILIVTGTGINVAGTLNTGSGIITGNGSGLSALAGANVSGQVGNALVAGTVYTAAQPNITSVGTLTGLTSNGVVDFANTSNTTLGAVGNVHITGGTSGQYLQTDGSGTLSWATVTSGSTSNISNGNSNVNIPSANGNVIISAVGNANVLVITGTGANITGTANISGNLSAGNITAGSGSGGNITGGNVISANTFTASGNITAGNAGLGNAVTANYFIGNLYGTANLATYATTANSVAGANVSGQVTFAATANSVAGANVTGAVTYATTANAVAGANVSGQVGNALVAGTVYTNAQPNITTVGSLLGLTVANATGVVNFTTTANIALGPVDNVHITGGTSGYVLSTDGSGNLSWVAQSVGGGSNISNGNSNVNIATANGNITFSAVGNANVMTITGTGVNVAGTLNATGNIVGANANLGNLVTANYFTGNGSLLTGITATVAETVSNAAQPNITSVGTLSNLAVSGTTNLGAVGNVTITGGNANSYLRTDGSGSLSWNALPTTTVTVDSFNGDGTTSAFTLSVTPTSKAYTTVTVGGVTQYQSSYTVSGTTLTFSSAPPSGTVIEVQTIASGGSATPITINTIGGSAYVGVSANTTMVAGNVYIVNTSSANLTMTLPASGNLGDSIGIIDGTGNANTHAITVGRNGGNIMGTADDMLITTPRAGLTMVYYNSTQGWILTQI